MTFTLCEMASNVDDVRMTDEYVEPGRHREGLGQVVNLPRPVLWRANHLVPNTVLLERDPDAPGDVLGYSLQNIVRW